MVATTMTPAGTRVTWFVLGVCVGVLLAVVGMAGIAEAASRTAPDTVPAHSGTPFCDRETGGWKSGTGQTWALDAAVPSPGGVSQALDDERPAPCGSEAARLNHRPKEVARRVLVPAVIADVSGGVPLTPKRPTAALAGPLISGEATWCAPTPRYCQSWGGNAMLGAVHSFRWGDEPYRVTVSRGEASVTVRVVSYCACLGRDDTIDLSTEAFSRLAPLSRGRIAVELEGVR